MDTYFGWLYVHLFVLRAYIVTQARTQNLFFGGGEWALNLKLYTIHVQY